MTVLFIVFFVGTFVWAELLARTAGIGRIKNPLTAKAPQLRVVPTTVANQASLHGIIRTSRCKSPG